VDGQSVLRTREKAIENGANRGGVKKLKKKHDTMIRRRVLWEEAKDGLTLEREKGGY